MIEINLYNQDCMPAMENMKENQYSLAICDPPYGIGASKDSRVGGSYTVNLGGKKHKVEAKAYTQKDWDFKKPTIEYWEQLKRVSKNQIIWGGNYFIENLYETNCWIVWNKKNGKNNNADCELAWTSFDTAVRMFEWKWNGLLQENMKNKQIRIHPTEKPIALYKWLLKNYAKEGDKIFDSHGGSMSIVIACIEMGFSIDCYEIDKEYFDAAVNRIKVHLSQGNLFRKEEIKLNIYKYEKI